MSMSPSEPASESPDGRQIREMHELEIRRLQIHHAAMLSSVRESFGYRLGETILGLRSRKGRRAFPRRMRELVQDLWEYRLAARRNPATNHLVDPRLPVEALSILDEFTHACLGPELGLRPARRAGSDEQFDGVSLLLAETAWRGKGGEWTYAFSKFSEDPDLAGLLESARRRGIPSALWNKEDPVGYDEFLAVAREFDHVFTTDSDQVERYKRDLGHGRVRSMMFAAQPMLHHPIRDDERAKEGVAYAGAWRGAKYPGRARELTTLLDAAASVGSLEIFARDARSDATRESGFPDRFARCIVGSVPYSEMGSVYRSHACLLNVNSVSDSTTMLSRRVLEALACRTPVVSSPSKALEAHFSDVVLVPQSFDEARDMIEWAVTDRDAADRLAHRGYRLVHQQHTYAKRIDAMCSAIGLKEAAPARTGIDVVCVSNRPERLEAALANFERQTYASKKLIVVTNHDGFDRGVVDARVLRIPGARTIHLPEALTLGECLNIAVESCKGEWFAKFDDDDFYGAEYLSDFMLAAGYSGASVMGKRTGYAYLESLDQTVIRNEGHEFTWTDHVMGGTIVARRNDVGSIPFRPLVAGTDTQFMKECTEAGLPILSVDRYNYLMTRYRSAGGHTWKISDDRFMKECRVVASGEARTLVVV